MSHTSITIDTSSYDPYDMSKWYWLQYFQPPLWKEYEVVPTQRVNPNQL